MKSRTNLSLSSKAKRGLSEEELKKLESSYKSARYFISRIADVLEKEVDTKILQSENELKYENPNWMLYQADNRGYRRALRDALSLIGA